jgi:5-bromo-4-chloroindolyl phosphate hydrolysis protein
MGGAIKIGGKDVKRTLQDASAGVMLYLFAAVLFISSAYSLITGDYRRFVLKAAAFGMATGAAWLMRRGVREANAYAAATVAKAPKIPYKTIASILLGIDVFVLGFILGDASLLNSVVVAVFATLGAVLYYGIDPAEDKLPQKAGVDGDFYYATLQEARSRMEALETLCGKMGDASIERALKRAIEDAEAIVRSIEEDPKNIRFVRRFLVVYLEGVRDVAQRYVALDEREKTPDARAKLSTVLQAAHRRFEEDLKRLKENETFDFEVRLETLKRQLEQPR